jgi:predicted phage-related endonuclease
MAECCGIRGRIRRHSWPDATALMAGCSVKRWPDEREYALIGGNTFQWTYVERDEDIISMLIRTERDFWNLVEDDGPPPPDGSDACVSFLSQRYPKSIPLSKIELPATAASLIRQYNEANEQLERLTEQKQKAGNQLKELLGDNEAGNIGNDSIAWKTVTQERFDSKLLESERPELYRQYIRKTSYRRFTVKVSELNKNQE